MTTTLAGAASGTAVRTHRRDAQRADRAGRAATPETHGAGAVAAIAGTLALSLPAVALLDRPAGTATVDVVASFLIVGGLEVVAARSLWRLTRSHAHPAAYAALLARLGYALLLVVGALVLLVQGPSGTTAFGAHWGSALGVLGLHLVAVGVALRRCPAAGQFGPLLLSACGAAGLAAALSPVDGVPLTAALAPVLVGEVVLAGVLLRTTTRRPVA